ncbi:MAG: glycosyltransferase [Chloroflexota bacterium]
MKITFLALGSRGDIQPYAALGRALTEAGHEVSFISTENYKNLIEERGINFYPIPGNAEHLVKNKGADTSALMWAFRNTAKGMITNAKQILPALTETDLILNQLPGGAFSLDIQEKYGIPMSLAATIPLIQTSAFPMMGWPRSLAKFPRYNSWSYKASEHIAWAILKSLINQWRQDILGLSKITNSDYFRRHKVPVLNGFSKHIVPKPPDWGNDVSITGYWFESNGGWEPPKALINFIERGKRPIYIGFGSMPVRNPKKTTQTIIHALEESGERAVVNTGWGDLVNIDLPDHVFKIEYAPFDWLFPRMKAVVHHGGSGTTAAGLRSGVPSLIIPFLFDQFFWADRIIKLGAGPDPIPYRKLSAASLAKGIGLVVNDPKIRENSAKIGAKIRTEDGINNAIRVIREHNNT